FSDSLTNSMKNTDKTLKKMNGNLEDAQKNLEDAQKNLKAAMEKLNAAENEKYWYGIGGVVIGGVVGIVVAVIGKR
ncbi:MAG: DUF4175 domain-containing protein, partial [Ignavibacteria bacterium]|nr:DUF4175 domain-containing protein [Ignavibacteria bacterium]